MSIDEFYIDFRQEIIGRASAAETFTKAAFLDYLFPKIEEQGYPAFEQAEFRKSLRKEGFHAVDAWASDNEGRLFLAYADFRQTDTVAGMTENEMIENFARLERFFFACRKKEFVQNLEESTPHKVLAQHIFERQSELKTVSLLIFSNAKLSNRVKSLKDRSAEGFRFIREVWDFERIWQLETSGYERESIVIDFTEDSKKGVPCLAVPAAETELKSYLLVFSGTLLANLYERYGERLLEQNVRTFLQFKGKVNKGIRDTIIKEPRKFFAYNNGICATAEAVVPSQDGSHLLKVTNLQIVNGGQTTAAIFTANRKDKAPISNVFVQAKLTIVEPDKVIEIVPNISKFANTQNKVSEADLASNSPFQMRVKELSERIWAPSAQGGVSHTLWFYERARGQFANAQVKLTDAEKRKFNQQNPKEQRFDKTDFAKTLLAFDEKPHFVSLGAQKAFAKFVGDIAVQWNENENRFNDFWFKEAIAKMLCFRNLDRAVKTDPFFKEHGSYKASIIAYTLATFARLVKAKGKAFKFEMEIWQKQNVPEAVLRELVAIAKQIADCIVHPPPGETLNHSEWAKKEKCWAYVSSKITKFGNDLSAFLMNLPEYDLKFRTAAEDFLIRSGTEARKYIAEKGADYWCHFREWDNGREVTFLSKPERAALEKACDMPQKYPNPKQCRLLKEAEEKAREEGFSAD